MPEKEPFMHNSGEVINQPVSDLDLRLACIVHDLGWIAGTEKLFDTRPYVREMGLYPSFWGGYVIPAVHPEQLELV